MKLLKISLLCSLLSITNGIQRVQEITTSGGFTFKIDLDGLDGDSQESEVGDTAADDSEVKEDAVQEPVKKVQEPDKAELAKTPVLYPKVEEKPEVKQDAVQEPVKKEEEPIKAESIQVPVKKVEVKPQEQAAPAAKAEAKTFETIKQEIESQIQAQVHAKPNPDGLRWDHTPAELKELSVSLIKKSNATINAILSSKEPRTFDNTIKPISNLESDIEFDSQPLVFYQSVAVSKQLRDAAKQYEKDFSEFNMEMWMRDDIYQAFVNYKKNAEKDGSFKKLDAETQRYVDQTLSDFKRNGLLLNKVDRDKLKKLTTEIGDLETLTSTNIAEDKEFVEFNINEMEGVPEDLLEQIKQVNAVKGKPGMVKVSLAKDKAGSYMAAFTNENTRKKMKEAMDNVNRNNLHIVDELNQKRDESARLLNYTNNSERTLEDKMAKNIDNVEKLLNDLTLRISEQGSTEMEKLVQFKRKKTGNATALFESWDFGHYAGKYDQEVLDLDESSMSDFFPSERVVAQTQQIYQDLLGLTFKKIEKPSVWHKDVTMYAVSDTATQKLLGHFYLDLYPRPDKFNHAACFTLTKRHRQDKNKFQLATAAMVTNLNAPTKDEPSLLSHDDVVTFFHEFGHVMHNMCNEANYTKFSGASVEQDFVEMPSQMLENWMWQPSVLKKISRHYKTGKTLDDETIQKKIASKNLHSATETLNQITMATVDLIMNSAQYKPQKINSQQALVSYFSKGDSIGQFRKTLKYKPDHSLDTGDLWRTVEEKIENIHDIPGVNPIGHLGHLMSGYVSTYYSYLWSEVYSADLFSVFKKEGIFNKDLGMRYRKTILAPGGSVDSIDSVRKFLGRDPNDKAFLINNGFTNKKVTK